MKHRVDASPNSRGGKVVGQTQSLCPHCLAVAPAEIVERGGRVYFRKRCPQHGVREDSVSGDARWFDRHVTSSPGKTPLRMAIEPRRGCPYDCGLCTEHQQHTCLALLEITGGCNLTCPMCFASSKPGDKHLSVEACRRAIDHLVAAEGRPEVLQLSGGEPTIHPRLMEIVAYACDQPIDVVMINTNGVRLAKDPRLVDALAERRDRVEVYLQFDGFDDAVYGALRGESLLDLKLRAVEACGRAGLNMTLVATLQAGVNFGGGREAWLGRLFDYATARPWVAGISLQPASYVGRFFQPAELEDRVTLPDAIHAVDHATGGRLAEGDFTPLPCAHPNAHAIAYAYRSAGRVTPLARLIDIGEHIDLLSGRITYTRPRARRLIEEYLSRQCCGPGGCGGGEGEGGEGEGDRCRLPPPAGRATRSFDGSLPVVGGAGRLPGPLAAISAEFVERALAERLDPGDMFRVTVTSFMDAYNFDLRQLMTSCVHFVLPSGHLIPFSAYNVLYREGHAPLPPISGAPALEPPGPSQQQTPLLPILR
ncbi:MAG: radical SAM protein [Planctomycetota bacterium]